MSVNQQSRLYDQPVALAIIGAGIANAVGITQASGPFSLWNTMVGIIILCILQAYKPAPSAHRPLNIAYAATWSFTLLTTCGILFEAKYNIRCPDISSGQPPDRWNMQKMEKWCPKCQQYLSRDEFYRNSTQADGLAPYCKPCWSETCSKRHARLREGLSDKRRVQMDLVRHGYFKRIERPIQAYVLGLLASDGNVASDRPRIQFSVHEEDRILTEIVRDELAPGSSIMMPICRTYRLAKVHFTSPEMYADLAKLGIIPRKSHALTWPEMLPGSLINSYLLGVLDGDGWITIDKRKPMLYYTIGIISASPTFLERAAQEINAAIDVPLVRLSAVNQRAFTIRYGGKSAILMSEWLHRDLPGLARKRIPT